MEIPARTLIVGGIDVVRFGYTAKLAKLRGFPVVTTHQTVDFFGHARPHTEQWVSEAAKLSYGIVRRVVPLADQVISLPVTYDDFVDEHNTYGMQADFCKRQHCVQLVGELAIAHGVDLVLLESDEAADFIEHH